MRNPILEIAFVIRIRNSSYDEISDHRTREIKVGLYMLSETLYATNPTQH